MSPHGIYRLEGTRKDIATREQTQFAVQQVGLNNDDARARLREKWDTLFDTLVFTKVEKISP